MLAFTQTYWNLESVLSIISCNVYRTCPKARNTAETNTSVLSSHLLYCLTFHSRNNTFKISVYLSGFYIDYNKICIFQLYVLIAIFNLLINGAKCLAGMFLKKINVIKKFLGTGSPTFASHFRTVYHLLCVSRVSLDFTGTSSLSDKHDEQLESLKQ